MTADTAEPAGPAGAEPAAGPAEVPARRRRMEIFALSPRRELEELAASLKGFPAPVELRPAESGLVMARGRIGGDGSAFNLGEILVSRCCLSVDGIAGFGYVLSGDLRHAELCALLDALGSRPGSREAVAAAAEELGRRRLEEALRAEEEAKKTKVEFFTMVRGDD